MVMSLAIDYAYAGDNSSLAQSQIERFAAPKLAASIAETVTSDDGTISVQVGVLDLGHVSLETYGDLEDTKR